MNKEYVAPLIKVLDARLGEAVNLGVGSGKAGEQDQLSKQATFEEDDNENSTPFNRSLWGD